MFTGIVEELGTVVSLEDQGDAVRLTVRGPLVTQDAASATRSPSTACCLTVAEQDGQDGNVHRRRHERDAEQDLARRPEPGRPGQPRARGPRRTRLGGHVVQGHVDGIGTVVRARPSEHWEVVEIALPRTGALRREKGSITVDGVSLTVVEVDATEHLLGLPDPETLARTTLGAGSRGDRVNLEVDVLAKYVERLARSRPMRMEPEHDESTRPRRGRDRRHRRGQGRSSWSTTRTARTRATSSSRRRKATPELMAFTSATPAA